MDVVLNHLQTASNYKMLKKKSNHPHGPGLGVALEGQKSPKKKRFIKMLYDQKPHLAIF